MRILIVSHYFPPLNSIASHRPYSWAKQWVADGHHVSILTTEKVKEDFDLTFDLSQFNILTYKNLYTRLKSFLSVKSKDENHRNQKENLFLKIGKIIKEFIKKRGVLIWDARMPSIFNSGKSSAYNLVKCEWDLVISTSAPFGSHLIARRLKRNGYAKKWVLDYRDLWTQSHLFFGLFPFTVVEEILEKSLVADADLVTTVSKGLADSLASKFNINPIVIENGFDVDDLAGVGVVKKVSNKVRVVHAGSIYSGYRDPSPLFEAIKLIESENPKILTDFKVVFLGGNLGNLDQIIDKYDVSEYVDKPGMVSRIDSLRIQKEASALLLLEFEDENVKGVLTGKLFEYLFSGTEVWVVGVGCESDIGAIISESNQGICFGLDVNLIKNKLMELMINGPRTVEINHSYLNKYTRKFLARKLLSIVNDEY